MNDVVFILFFLSIFHVLGGAAIGFVVRSFLRGKGSPNTIFFLIWGGMFGGMPLIIGASLFSAMESPHWIIVESSILVATILISALIPDAFIELFKTPEIGIIAFGGIFALVGIGVGVAALKSDPLFALLFGGLFAATGALMFYAGLKQLFKRTEGQ